MGYTVFMVTNQHLLVNSWFSSRKVSPMATTSKNFTQTFINNRWIVDGSTRLSMSYWDDKAGYTTYSVILERLTNGKWKLDHSTAREFRNKRQEDASWYATYYAGEQVKAILGEAMPMRFFRDNVIG